MEPMTLREAARRTSRSITTLRRYIRNGRLRAQKRQGRFGPEYFVSERELADAGLAIDSAGDVAALSRHPGSRAELATVGGGAAERILRDAVPLSLYRELQMKHEQLLVQYGMMRAGGLRALEIRADLEANQRELEQSRAQALELRREATQLRKQLRQAELEQEGQGLQISALQAKIRGLEMLTRNAVTSDTIEKQFSEVVKQSRRVERMSTRQEMAPGEEARENWPPAPRREEPDH